MEKLGQDYRGTMAFLPERVRFEQRPSFTSEERPLEAADSMIIDSGPSLQRLFRVLKKRLRLAVAIALAVLAMHVAYVLFAPRIYRASAILEIRGYAPILGQAELENLLGRDTRKIEYQKTTIAKLTQLGMADRALNTDGLAADLKGYFASGRTWFSEFKSWIRRTLLPDDDSQADSVAPVPPKAAGPHYTYPERFLNSYLGLLDVEPIHETNLVEVSAETTDPKLSQRIANQHAQVFIEHLREERQAELTENLRALSQHSEELRQRLAKAEENVAEYARKHELVAFSGPGGDNLIAKNMAELNELLAQVTAKRIKSESLLKELEEGRAGASPVDDETIVNLRVKLQEAETMYAQLAQKVTPAFPALAELGARVQALKKAIRDEREQGVKSLRTEYASDKASEELLTKQLAELRQKANDLSTKAVEYNLLVREADSLRELSQQVLKELKQTQISVESSRSNIFVSDFAALPKNPTSPKVSILLIFGAALGLALGAGVALCIEALDSSIETTEDAREALQLSALGCVPEFEQPSTEPPLLTSGKLRRLVGRSRSSTDGRQRLPGSRDGDGAIEAHGLAPDAAAAQPLIAREIIALTAPQARVSEALRTLRASILFSSPDRPPRVIMVTSSVQGEGKTTLTTNLAVSLALGGHRTILIDGDLRHPKSSSFFGVSGSRAGLVDFLTGHTDFEEMRAETQIKNLHFVPTGARTPNPTELLGSNRMRELLAALSGAYDFVLVDSPPVLPVADSLMLAPFVDTILFVTRSGKTDRSVAQEAVRRLRRVGARILGVVVNGVRTSVAGYSVDGYTVVDYGVTTPAAHTPDEHLRRANG